jgi:hypothetical protein
LHPRVELRRAADDDEAAQGEQRGIKRGDVGTRAKRSERNQGRDESQRAAETA